MVYLVAVPPSSRVQLMKLVAPILLCAGFLVSSCSSTSHIVTGQTRDPIDEEQVKLYTTPPKKFEEVAILMVKSSGWSSQGELDSAIEGLKEEAAELGANGVLLTGHGSETSGVIGSINQQTGAFYAAQARHTTMEARAIFVVQE